MTAVFVTDDMVMVDVNGKRHPISRRNIAWMLGAGWMFFLASQCLNFVFYKIHPSSVDCSVKAISDRFKRKGESVE